MRISREQLKRIVEMIKPLNENVFASEERADRALAELFDIYLESYDFDEAADSLRELTEDVIKRVSLNHHVM